MFFIAYAFKGQVHVFAGRVKIVSHLSCRSSAIYKYFCPLSPKIGLEKFLILNEAIMHLFADILSDTKRIKLLMQVFKMNNARVEEVAKVKLNVWWHFIWLLGNKITSNFDMVNIPCHQILI